MMDDFISLWRGFLAACVTVLTAIFGTYWFLFAGYIALNITDWLTGWAKARKKGEETSKKGLEGIVKKTGYWVLTAVAFLVAALFIELGKVLDINLSIALMFGWFTLACLIVNEVRSILENLVELGYNVPNILIKGLEIADDLINKAVDEKFKK